MPSRRTVLSTRDPDNNIVQVLEIVELIKSDPRQASYQQGPVTYCRVDNNRKIECTQTQGKRIFFDAVRQHHLTEI